MTAWGPLNYLLGAVLTLGTLALWHSWRDRPVWVRLLERDDVTLIRSCAARL